MDQESGHRLMQWTPRGLFNWVEWKASWDKTPLLEFRHSLLHFGFQLPDCSGGDRVERLLFYLEIADHHGHHLQLGTPDEMGAEPSRRQTTLGVFCYPSEVRQQIARKAFQVLCLNFFKSSAVWMDDVRHPAVMDKILWFFRTGPYGGLKNIPYIGADNHARIAQDFAIDFCQFVWRSSFYRFGRGQLSDLETTRRYFAARPSLVRLLYGLGKIDILLQTDEYPMDLLSLLALKDLVMGSFYYLPDQRGQQVSRLPKSLEEAVLAGSRSARVLKLLMIMGQERKRLGRVVAAERMKHEADAVIKR